MMFFFFHFFSDIDTSPQGIKAIAAAGEGPRVEFKARNPSSESLAKIVAAFANADGGLVLVGVSEEGFVGGLPEGMSGEVQQTLERIAQALLPYPVEVGRTEFNNQYVVWAKIPPAPEEYRPILTSSGEAFTRQANKTVPLSVTATMSATLPALTASLEVSASDPIRLFVAMSFRENEEPALADYYQAIRRAAGRVNEETGTAIEVVRMDEVEGDYEISARVHDEIDKANVVVADFTLSPHNVYYEAGYARGKGRRLIQTARQDTVLQFDTRNWRTLSYKNATELEAKFYTTLRAAVGGS
jgi:hypothetical protein